MIETVRSFADGTGVLLASAAAVILGYLYLGDWMLRTDLMGRQDHFAGVVIAFVCALLLSVATVLIFKERWEMTREAESDTDGDGEA
jgi:hypothetical protein